MRGHSGSRVGFVLMFASDEKGGDEDGEAGMAMATIPGARSPTDIAQLSIRRRSSRWYN